MLRKLFLLLFLALGLTATSRQLARGLFGCSVELRGVVSKETGRAPRAYLWLPEGQVGLKAVVLAQQNMTEEAFFRMEVFRRELSRLGVGFVWVAPAFSQDWSPQSGCQEAFEAMMADLAAASGHAELSSLPIIPLGHSAQATFPWNFAAWNPGRTLCIVSFHGDAPRTNLCGYGRDNVEWGRRRNIDGIPGLMVEGEYEWWLARVRPALAFRMMYPASCISFLCDAGRGHFDCGEPTALYVARFIEKSLERRLCADGSLASVSPSEGWLLASPWSPDGQLEAECLPLYPQAKAAPWASYEGDPHTAFWYFDGEMAREAERRYAESAGKRRQYVGFEYAGRLVPYDKGVQGGLRINFDGGGADSVTFTLRPVLTDSTHTCRQHSRGARLHIEVVSGPVRQLNDTTFRLAPYEAGWDNPRRSFSCMLVAVAEPTSECRGAVQPINVRFPPRLVERVEAAWR